MFIGVGNISENGNITIGSCIINIRQSDVFNFNPFETGSNPMVVFESNGSIKANLNGETYETSYFLLVFSVDDDFIKKYTITENAYESNSNISSITQKNRVQSETKRIEKEKKYLKSLLVSDNIIYPIIPGPGSLSNRISSDKITLSDNIRFVLDRVNNSIVSCAYELTNNTSSFIYGDVSNTGMKIMYFTNNTSPVNQSSQSAGNNNQVQEFNIYAYKDEIPEEEKNQIAKKITTYDDYIKYKNIRGTRIKKWNDYISSHKGSAIYNVAEIKNILNQVNNSGYCGNDIKLIQGNLNQLLYNSQNIQNNTDAITSPQFDKFAPIEMNK